MFLLGFRRKLTALALCKSIESAIQWVQIHYRITFATIQNPAVYLSGARVSIFSTLVPRLYSINGDPIVYWGFSLQSQFIDVIWCVLDSLAIMSLVKESMLVFLLYTCGDSVIVDSLFLCCSSCCFWFCVRSWLFRRRSMYVF